MSGRLSHLLEQAQRQVQAAHARLPELGRIPGGITEWLKGARRAQILLGLTLVLGIWVVPPLIETILEALLPSSTTSSGFLGMSKRTVSHPLSGPLSAILVGAFFLVGLSATIVTLWKAIPTTLQRLTHENADALGQTLPPPAAFPSSASSAATTAATLVASSAGQATADRGHSGATVESSGATPPRLSGRYAVQRQLGEGGMGQVFLAEDTTLGRLVALKKLPPELVANEAMRERFRREARALAQLNHVHVVQLFDFLDLSTSASEDQGMWMVMEVVSGGDLEDRLKGGRIELSEVCRLGRQMAAALAAAHERGIVHRDFKPANVMLTESGDAKVADFGIAQLEAASAGVDTKLTQAGTVMGTPTYMSPEQARGDQVGAPSDVYALGAALYEMVCGEPVFSGTLTQVLAAHITRPPDPLASRGVEVPQRMEELVQEMLSKEPNDRPTLREIIDTLDSVSG